MMKLKIHKFNLREIIALIIIICMFISIIKIVFAPESPHNIEGYVFHSDGATYATDLPVFINNTAIDRTILVYTLSVPPIEPFIGFYSAQINGSDGDRLIVKAWNSSHFGNQSILLLSTTTYLNITLNFTRQSETNLTIILPANNTLLNITRTLNVTVNVSLIGGMDSAICNATISFSDNGVLALNPNEAYTHGLGNLTLGGFNYTTWILLGNKTGSENITVSSDCLFSGQNFDGQSIKTVYNITVIDIIWPSITLNYPPNNSILNLWDASILTFKYTVSDSSSIANCSLIINNRINMTNTSIEKDIIQNFTVIMTNGSFLWSVNCTDNSTTPNFGASPVFNLTILGNTPPAIFNLAVESVINLAPGQNSIIRCNATVRDENNISDIRYINATFYNSVSFHDDTDDNNRHYANSSCAIIRSGTYEANYSCSFSLAYYANNGTWMCNISAIDMSNTIGFGNKTSFINELLAIEVSPLIIDYGNIQASMISPNISVNITNIGNIAFNTTVDGFGVTDGDNLSMRCLKGNISISNQRYSIIQDSSFNSMTNLTDYPIQIANLSLPQRTYDINYGNDRNFTYWRLELPTGIQGDCNGTVTFKAIVI